MNDLPLGKPTSYPDRYAPDVLFPIPRSDARDKLGIGTRLPFDGMDLWTAWELTWLTSSGKPAMAAAEIRVPATSPNIIESKSLKLYLNSFAMTTPDGGGDPAATIARDLSACAGARVDVRLFGGSAISPLPGESLDDLDVALRAYDVDTALLEVDTGERDAQTWHSGLLRSLCPVTAQPDFGSVMIRYEGPRIRPESLLAYIVSFRRHQDFHEACVERMFIDLKSRCAPDKLTVYARYQRRGGLDINPFRSDFETIPPEARTWNQ
jgi:7-cyano-7-deazaguanine reductase